MVNTAPFHIEEPVDLRDALLPVPWRLDGEGGVIGALFALAAVGMQGPAPLVPPPSGDPLAIRAENDPLFALARQSAPPALFRDAVAAAVRRNAATIETVSLSEEAEAGTREARQARLPSADLSLSAFQTIAREFSDDPENIIERSRADRRTDLLGQVNVPVFDWGAADARVDAAFQRLRAASADVENTADRTALALVAAWVEVFAYRAMLGVADSRVIEIEGLQGFIGERIAAGVNAETDAARAGSYAAGAAAERATVLRRLRAAEARYREIAGTPPPEPLGRPPLLADPPANAAEVATLAGQIPAVRAARATAQAARLDARAADRDRLPSVSAGIDAGRYGVIETERDFDVRARISVRQRFGGGIGPRADAAAARARSADARASRITEESAREAAVALADVQALEAQLASLGQAYIDARRSRDAIVERFRVARGTLFDVLAAEDVLFGTAASWLRTLAELDASRYVLLSRTGRLLPAFGLEANTLGAASAPAR